MVKVGEDYGNFTTKVKTRSFIYRDQSEASRISPEWNSWLRFISNTRYQAITLPMSGKSVMMVTGLDSAYKPSV